MDIPEYRIEIIPLSDVASEEMGFEWADDCVGKRSKIGGSPKFLQDEFVPACNRCGLPMSFYAQIDSVGDNLVLADAGMVYVFVCFDCFETTSFIQS